LFGFSLNKLHFVFLDTVYIQKIAQVFCSFVKKGRKLFLEHGSNVANENYCVFPNSTRYGPPIGAMGGLDELGELDCFSHSFAEKWDAV
jgi:hypothetical protein